jgi:hypothetical protein
MPSSPPNPPPSPTLSMQARFEVRLALHDSETDRLAFAINYYISRMYDEAVRELHRGLNSVADAEPDRQAQASQGSSNNSNNEDDDDNEDGESPFKYYYQW